MKQRDIFKFDGIARAIALQRELSSDVIRSDDLGFNPRFVCGMDVAYKGRTAYVAAAVWDARLKTIVETQQLVDKTATDYVPGFLAFREGPMLLRAVSRISNTLDAFLIDGQGIAHPRGFGLASHVGLAFDRPTIGVAKSRLYGRVEGDYLIGANDAVIGRILKSETRKKYYVSIGHRVSLETAIKTVQNSMVDGFPAPLRRAHLDSIFLKGNAMS